MTPLPVSSAPGAVALLATLAAVARRLVRLVRADGRGAPPPAERHWASGTTLEHLVQDVR